MNTVEIGNIFEDQVYKRFSLLLDENELHINSRQSLIKKKPQYFSEARNGLIEFDISIETTQKNSNQVSMLTIIECKNYSSKKVPVDDIEEFISKLNQVSGKNIKGIICTKKGFQKSCLNVAKYNGIALVRISSERDLFWDIYRKSFSLSNAIHIDQMVAKTLFDENRNIPEDFFCAYHSDFYTYSIKDFFKSIGFCFGNNIQATDSDLNFNISYITENEIKNIILKEFEKYKISINYSNYLHTYDEYINKKIKEFELIGNCDLGIDSNGFEIIGRLSGKKIYISSMQSITNGRFNFTLTHELGHSILHANEPWFEILSKYYQDVDINNQMLESVHQNLKRIEVQANIYAKELLLPNKVLNITMNRIIDELRLKNKGLGYIYLDHQKVNRELLSKVISKLRLSTRASKAVIEIKLREMGYLTYAYKSKNVLDEVITKIITKKHTL